MKSLFENFNKFAEEEQMTSLNEMAVFRADALEKNIYNFDRCLNVMSPNIKTQDDKTIEKIIIISDKKLNGKKGVMKQHVLLYVSDILNDDLNYNEYMFDDLYNQKGNKLLKELKNISNMEPDNLLYAGYIVTKMPDTFDGEYLSSDDYWKNFKSLILKGYYKYDGYLRNFFKVSEEQILLGKGL
jgi:hypothetical protein